jgi:hypothetical protein
VVCSIVSLTLTDTPHNVASQTGWTALEQQQPGRLFLLALRACKVQAHPSRMALLFNSVSLCGTHTYVPAASASSTMALNSSSENWVLVSLG